MVTMQFSPDGIISDGKTHQIQPLEIYYKPLTYGESKIFNKMMYIITHRVNIDNAIVELNSLVLNDQSNYICLREDVDIDYYIGTHHFEELTKDPNTAEECLERANPKNGKDINICLGENIDVDNYIKNGGTEIHKKEYIPVLNPNIGESKFIGTAYELTNVFNGIELTKTATYEEKDINMPRAYELDADMEIDVEPDTTAHIFSYDSDCNLHDTEVMLVSGKHKYKFVFGTFNNPVDYKFARLANKITFEGNPENHVDVDFANIEKLDKKFYLADGSVYTSAKKRRRK